MRQPSNLHELEEQRRRLVDQATRTISTITEILSGARVEQFLRRLGLLGPKKQPEPTPTPTYKPPLQRRSWQEYIDRVTRP